tara:strand:- start:2760 stop:3032 length:273 start_codon:yes stop_codon:yes gene_type:complete
MSDNITPQDTISYFDWKVKYYKDFPNSSYRFGQCFINCFIKREDNTVDYNTLWETYNVVKAEEIIFDIIRKCNWDMMALVLVQDLIKQNK